MKKSKSAVMKVVTEKNVPIELESFQSAEGS